MPKKTTSDPGQLTSQSRKPATCNLELHCFINRFIMIRVELYMKVSHLYI